MIIPRLHLLMKPFLISCQFLGGRYFKQMPATPFFALNYFSYYPLIYKILRCRNIKENVEISQICF